MSKKKDMQRLIRHYKDETGEIQIDMKKVARFAKLKGWPMPVPKDPEEILARELSKAARDVTDHNKETGRPFRVYHSVPLKQGKQTTFVFVDINEAPRNMMVKSLNLRREQMVGDGLQLDYDKDHWNSLNPTEDQIQIELDLSFDVELRKHAADAEDEEV